MIINQFREYLQDKTCSAVFVDGIEYGQSLEDVGRPVGVKIQNETCIPEGVYKVAITDSPTFHKPLMILYNVDHNLSIERDGVRFTGIRVHSGSTVGHTAGCVLIKGYQSLQAQVQEAISSGELVLWVISGLYFNVDP